MTPIHKTTTVPLPPAEAFALFLARIDTWWPKDSHAPQGPDGRLEVDLRKNGDIKEIGPDGTENVWGRIIGLEPDSYVAFTWFPDCDEEDATVVAVSFKQTAEGTQLDLTHGGFDILGDTADAVSTSYLFRWDLVLGTYCFVARREAVPA